MSNHYQILNWDTEVFGFGVGKIVPERMNNENLADALALLRAQGVKLVYWASDSQDIASQQAAAQHKGFLADQKVTYLMSLDKTRPRPLTNAVEEYLEEEPDAALESLALASGMYSRFRMDPNIPAAICEKIYKLWIRNSVNKQIARAVLVVKRNQALAGMVTLGEKNARGDIGLLAVHEACRGLNIGADLVYAAQNWFISHGFAQSQVVTQLANKPACKLYEKCGYVIERVEGFYHFWLS